tara:strand:- start:185 stop:502 length:318 start_codon:yes stop_codon:yes gene_type:complete
MKKLTAKDIFWIAPIVVMAIGFLPMPYGYYTLSRLVVCGCSVYFAHRLYRENQTPFVWVFGFFAILYNPIIPVHLYQKETWMVVNAITAIFFIFKKGDALREDPD